MLTGSDLQRLIAESRIDAQAVDRLLEQYRPVLKLIAEQMIGSGLRRREDASDIVQRTVLEAYAAFAQFHGGTEAEFSSWLKQILRRNVSNLVRDNRAAKRDVRREQYLDATDNSCSVMWIQPAGRGSTPSQRVIEAEAALNLAIALEKLPEQQRTAVRMRHLEGRGIDEIAATMQKTPAAVAGLIRRGMHLLRETMAADTSWL